MAASGTLDLRDGLATVTRGTLLVVVSTLCLVLFNFLSRVILVDSPAADWNSFSLGLTFTGILAAVGTLGLPSAVARGLPYATTDAERRTIVRSSLGITVAAAGALGASLWIAAPRIAAVFGIPNLSLGIQFFSIAIAASIVAGLLASIFQGYSDVIPNAVFLQIANPGIFLVLLLIVVVLPSPGLSYTTALAAYALASIATLALLVGYATRRLPGLLPSGGLAPETRRQLLRFAAPLLVAGAMLSLSGSGDTVVLGFYHPSEVGTYTASLTLAKLIAIGINAASFIFLPVATRFLRQANVHALRLTYSTVTKWMVLLSMPLFLLFLVLSQRSLGFVYRSGYTTVVLPLQIAVTGAFGATLLGPGATTQIALGRVRLLAINSVVAGLVDVALALAFVPPYGYAGAAFAWGTSTLLYAALCLAELAVLDGIHPFARHFVVPLVATTLPAALLLFVARPHVPGWALPPIGIAVAGAFVVVVLLTRSLDEGDRLLLGAVERLIGRPVPFVRRLARWVGPS